MKMLLGLLLFAVFTAGCASEGTRLEVPKDSSATLYGEVTEDSVASTISQIHKLDEGKGAGPIYLFLRTNGGDVVAGYELIDAMKASRRPVYTIALGLTASMGAVIHSYGVKRFMTPYAMLMYHDFSLSTGERQKINITEQELKFVAYYMDEANGNISKRSGVPMDELLKHEANEWWVRSDEAMQEHLVDQVVVVPDYPSDIKF